MAASPPTMPDSEEACANGCGRPREVVGTGAFTLTLKFCRECSYTELAAVEETRLQAEPRLARLEVDLGPVLATRTLEDYPTQGGRGEIVAQAAGWLETLIAGEPTNLYLCGPVGEGKTGLAAALARRAASRGIICRFFVGRDWLDEVRRAQFQETGADPELAARSARLLILDDLGTERTTAFALERLLSLVDHRYRFRLPTIVTSNFTPGELVAELGKTDDTIGERIVSRLVENAIRIRFGYGNLRLIAEVPAA